MKKRLILFFLIATIVLSVFNVVVFSLPEANKPPFYDIQGDFSVNGWWISDVKFTVEPHTEYTSNWLGKKEVCFIVYTTNAVSIVKLFMHQGNSGGPYSQVVITPDVVLEKNKFYIIYTAHYKTDKEYGVIGIYTDTGQKIYDETKEFQSTSGNYKDWYIEFNSSVYYSKVTFQYALNDGQALTFIPLWNALDWVLYDSDNPKIKVIRVESYTSPATVKIYASNGTKFYEQGFSGNETNPETTYIFCNDTLVRVEAYGPAGSKSINITTNGSWIVKLSDELTDIYLNQTDTSNETATNETAVAGNAQLGIYVKKVTYDWGTGRQRVNGFSNTKVKFLFSNGTLITEKITDNAGFTGYVNISAPVTVKVRAYYEENKYEERSYKLQPNERRTDTFTFLFTSEGIKRGNILVVKAVDQNNNPLEDVYIKVYEYVADPINPHDGDLYAEGPTNSYGKFATSVAPGHVHIYADYNGTQKDQIVNVENDLTVIFTFNTETGTVATRTEQYADTTGTQFENSTVGQDLPLPNASEWWNRNKDKIKFIVLIAGLIIGVFLILYLLALGIGGVRKAWKKALRMVMPIPVLPVFLSSDQTKYLAIGIGAGLFIAIILLLMFKRIIIATRVFVVEDREPD